MIKELVRDIKHMPSRVKAIADLNKEIESQVKETVRSVKVNGFILHSF